VQQPIDELALHFDKLGLDPSGLTHVIEALGQIRRQYLHAALMARAQMTDRIGWQSAIFDGLLQPLIDLL